jgi:hypothetical protein
VFTAALTSGRDTGQARVPVAWSRPAPPPPPPPQTPASGGSDAAAADTAGDAASRAQTRATLAVGLGAATLLVALIVLGLLLLRGCAATTGAAAEAAGTSAPRSPCGAVGPVSLAAAWSDAGCRGRLG